MKLFNIAPNQKKAFWLFFWLSALVDGSTALAVSASEAMFIGTLGADALPLSYILLFIFMLASTIYIAYAQSKISVEDLFKKVSLFFGILVTGIAVSFSFLELNETTNAILLFAIKLGAIIWTYTSFSLYWNIADGYFSIRDAKGIYSILAASGCAGGVFGAGIVFYCSSYIHLETHYLLWIWVLCLFVSLPLISKIKNSCKRLESAISFDDLSSSFIEVFKDNFLAIKKSVYIRAIFIMYILLMIASALNEYVATFAFSDYVSLKESEKVFDEQSIQLATQLGLASLFASLNIGVNIFNFVVNLFVYNKLVSRFGVGNIALIMPMLFMIAFIWLLNYFALAPAIFSFFMYKGVIESVDANNENLMISVMPSSIRQQVRLMIESFIVPFSTAIAGFFLMFYASSEGTSWLSGDEDSLLSFFHFNSLSLGEISLIGFLIAFAALAFAFIARKEYPNVLENNLKSSNLDFSKSLEDILEEELTDNDLELKPKNSLEALNLALALQNSKPQYSLNIILEFSELFAEKEVEQASICLNNILEKNDFEIVSAAIKWALDSSINHPKFVLEVLAKQGFIDDKKEDENTESIFLAKSTKDLKSYSTDSKIIALKNIAKYGNAENLDFAMEMLEDSSEIIQEQALLTILECIDERHFIIANKVARLFKNSKESSALIIIDILKKLKAHDSLEVLFRGLSAISVKEQKAILDLIISFGYTSVASVVQILQDTKYSIKVRTLCLNALNHIFPSQLKMLADDLIDAEIKNIYKYLQAKNLLKSNLASVESLRKLLAWREKNSISYIILIMSLTGKLGSYEAIIAGLFSPYAKEASNALENIEESLDNKDFAKIQILLDEKLKQNALKYSIQTYGNFYNSEDDVLMEFETSQIDIDFFVVATILLEKNSPDFEKLLINKINTEKSGALRDLLVEILDEIVFESISKKEEKPRCLVLRSFLALSSCEYFSRFEPNAIVDLLDYIELVESDSSIKKEGIYIEFKDDSSKKIFLSTEDIYNVASDYSDAAMSLYFEEESL